MVVEYKGRYFLEDDDDLTSLAHFGINIESRAARMRIAGRRGENYLVPGRNGEVLNKSKPFEGNFLPLEMWAQGSESDGGEPADAEAQLDYWMDRISKLFSYHGLKRFVSASTPGYGRVNLIPNPSMENAGQLQLVAENVINNPSGEFSNADVIVRRNFADNPGMESSQADEIFRTNLVRNPRMAAEGDPTIVLRNFVQNPSLEAGTKFWRAQSNSKIMTSRKTRVAGTWPVQGQQSLRAVATGTGPTNSLVECHSVPVEPSTAYSFGGYFWQRTELNMTCRMFVRWFNKNGVFISATSNVDAVVAPDQYTQLVQANVTSPAGAATASIRFVLVNALQDDVFYIDAVMAHKGATLKPYFDGDTDEQDGLRHRWVDNVGRSTSQQYWVPPRGWYSPIATVKATTEHSRKGVQSAKVELTGATVTNDVLLRQTVLGGAPLEEASYVSGGIAIRRADDANDTPATRTVKLRLQCWDSDGNLLGTVLDGPGGSTLADVTTTLMPSVWNQVTIEGGYTLTDTEKVTLSVLCGEAWASGDIVYFDTAIVEPARKADEWFDGNIDDDDVFNYEWLDDAHWSRSYAKGSNVKGWMVAEGRQYTTSDGYLRESAMTLTPFRSPLSAERPAVHSIVLDNRPGRKHMLSMYVKLSRSVSVKLGVTYDNTLTWNYNTPTSPTAGTWTRLTFGFTVPVGTDPDDMRIGFFYNAAAVDGDEVKIDAVLLEPCELARKYFDGESGERYGWLDDPERSVSVRYRDAANGWHGYGDAYPISRRVTATGTQGSRVVRSVASQAGEMGVTFAQDGIDAELTYAFGIDLKPSVTRNGYVAIVWLDEEGTQIGISQSSTTSLTSASFTRKTITGTPTAGASIGVPIAVVVGAAADEWLDADGARFGFGTDTTFKDGDSASWKWSGERGFSESEDWEPGVDYWASSNGTLARNGSWSTSRSNNATYTVAGGTAGTQYVYAFKQGKGDDRRFELKTDKEPWLTFAVDCRSVSVNAQVEVGFLLSKWTKQGWTPASVPSLRSAKEPIVSGVDERVSYTVDTSAVSVGDATHFRPVVWLYNSGGAAAAAGQVLRLDSAVVSRDDVGAYMDGTGEYVVWLGDADASASRRVGPARRIQVERVAAIEPVVSHNGELARFSVLLNAPKTFWEDTIQKTQKLALPRKGGELTFDKFDGTAPIEDAYVRLNGPFKDIKLTDVESGEWIRVNERFGPDQNVIIDNDSWVVKRGNNKRLWTVVTFSDNGVLLPLTPPHHKAAPRIRVEADSIGRGAFMEVTARRRYHIG